MSTVLSQEEVPRLIVYARNLMHCTMPMMLYATGLRRAELCHLKLCDIGSDAWSFMFVRTRVAVTATSC